MHALRLALATVLLALLVPISPLAAQKKGGGSTPPPDPAIAFVQTSGNRAYIKVMNSDGTNVRTVIQLTSGSGFNTKPAMSPDGSQVAFGWDPNGLRGIYVVNVDGTGLHRLTPTVVSQLPFRCAWSPVPAPDGQAKIAFVDSQNSQGSGPMAIFVVNLDGSGLQQLTYSTVSAGQPAWSRDGTRLAFTRNTAVQMGLIVATLGVVGGQLAITQEVNLAAAAGSPLQVSTWLTLPAWGNVSDVLVVSASTADSGGNYDLWLVDPLNPHVPLRITNTPTSSEVFGTFGLNDSRIYFGNGVVYACNLDGSGRATVNGNALAPSHRRY